MFGYIINRSYVLLLIMFCSCNVYAESQCGSDVPMSRYTVATNDAIPASADSLSIELTGRFVKVQKKGQFIHACKDSAVRYHVTSSAGEATCRINGVNVPQEGRMDLANGSKRIMCTDRPTGNDLDRIRIVAVD